MTAARYFRVQLPLFAFATAASVVACIWLIPIYGLYGAAAALIITTAVQVCGGIAVVAHTLYRLRKPTMNG
jgi:O-antigen/teichoic acid export membrane protein